MKTLAGTIVVLILFLGSFLLTFATGFYNLGGELGTLSWKVISFFSPYLGTLVDGQILALMMVVAGMSVGLLRGYLKRSYLAVSIFCLVYGIGLYGIGQFYLTKTLAFPWLTMTLLGPLYAVIFTLIFAGLYLWKESSQTKEHLPRKGLAGTMVVLNLFLMSILVTYITFFCNLGGEGEASFWKLYPSLPPTLKALVSGEGFILMAVIAGIGAAFLHGYLKRSYLMVSLFCLVSGFIPFLVGRIFMFRDLGRDNAAIGHWLAMMLLGPLYALIFSLVFAGLYLWKEGSRAGKNPPVEEKIACLSTVK